jgi:Zn2+/Cd2+-exporting ATPase
MARDPMPCGPAATLTWRLAFLDEQYLADPVAGAAAALVAIPVLAAGWNSVVRPSLPGSLA